MTKANYDAQKVAYNVTIQHTVANATLLPGVSYESVTDISVSESQNTGGRSRNARNVDSSASAGVLPVLLKYKITVFDPVLTVEKLRSQLVQAAAEGKMDSDLHFYATQFNAIGLNNGTFSAPQVTNAVQQRDSSSQLTGVSIALLVCGVLLFLAALAFIVWFAYNQEKEYPVISVKKNTMETVV